MAKQILSFEEYSKNLKGSDVGEHDNPEGYPAPEGETDDVENFNNQEVEEEEDREEEVADADDVEETEEVEEDEEEQGTEEPEEAALKVAEQMVKTYKSVVMEACEYTGDDYEDHTLSTYMKENAALVATLAAQALEEAYTALNEDQEMANETYEAMMSEMSEAYVNKIDQCREAFTGDPRGAAETEGE